MRDFMAESTSYIAIFYRNIYPCLVKYCQAPGPVQGPGQGPVNGPGQGLNYQLKIRCQILK